MTIQLSAIVAEHIHNIVAILKAHPHHLLCEQSNVTPSLNHLHMSGTEQHHKNISLFPTAVPAAFVHFPLSHRFLYFCVLTMSLPLNLKHNLDLLSQSKPRKARTIQVSRRASKIKQNNHKDVIFDTPFLKQAKHHIICTQ